MKCIFSLWCLVPELSHVLHMKDLTRNAAVKKPCFSYWVLTNNQEKVEQLI